MPRKKNNFHKADLFVKQNGLCYWCKEECILLTKINGGSTLPKEATIDHLYQLGHPKRTSKRGIRHTVMACFECNNKRSLYQTYSTKTIGHWKNASKVFNRSPQNGRNYRPSR